jgi:hypothetical protein
MYKNNKTRLEKSKRPLLWIKRKIADVWQPPIQIAYSSGSSFIGMNGYTISNSNISYTSYIYSYSVDTIINNPTTYGVNDPTDDDSNGYIITLIYKTQDGTGNQEESIRISQMYQISDIDEDFIFTTITEQ